MRVPESVAQTLNAYLAFRATLLAVVKHNRNSPSQRIHSIVVPGLGTGIGAMDARRCAAQMRIAMDHVFKPARIPSFSMIHEVHHRLRSAV
jgi:O-acetyl-ADP-ribose deacetylase (regulator of RNase III)